MKKADIFKAARECAAYDVPGDPAADMTKTDYIICVLARLMAKGLPGWVLDAIYSALQAERGADLKRPGHYRIYYLNDKWNIRSGGIHVHIENRPNVENIYFGYSVADEWDILEADL